MSVGRIPMPKNVNMDMGRTPLEGVPPTAPFDPRFPNTNQTRYCYQSYIDFNRCKNKHSEDFPACQYFHRVYHSLCPNGWIEKWDDQIAEGTFAGNI